MPKLQRTSAEMFTKTSRSNVVNRERYAHTDYFRILGAMGGRAGRGSKKPRGGPAARRVDRTRKEPLKRSGLETATMAEVLAELER